MVCQRKEDLLYFRDQVAYSRQLNSWDVARKPITEAERIKAQKLRRAPNPQNKGTKQISAMNVPGKERKKLSLKNREVLYPSSGNF